MAAEVSKDEGDMLLDKTETASETSGKLELQKVNKIIMIIVKTIIRAFSYKYL